MLRCCCPCLCPREEAKAGHAYEYCNTNGGGENGDGKSEVFFKIGVFGGSCGKTCLRNRLVEDRWTPDPGSTSGIDYNVKKMTIAETHLKLQICDFAGGSRFWSVSAPYLRMVDGLFLVFDVTSSESLDQLQEMLARPDIVGHLRPSVKMILLGNKCDCSPEERQVSDAQGKSFAEQLGIPYMEVSAKDGKNTSRALYHMLTSVMLEHAIGPGGSPHGKKAHVSFSATSQQQWFLSGASRRGSSIGGDGTLTAAVSPASSSMGDVSSRGSGGFRAAAEAAVASLGREQAEEEVGEETAGGQSVALSPSSQHQRGRGWKGSSRRGSSALLDEMNITSATARPTKRWLPAILAKTSASSSSYGTTTAEEALIAPESGGAVTVVEESEVMEREPLVQRQPSSSEVLSAATAAAAAAAAGGGDGDDGDDNCLNSRGWQKSDEKSNKNESFQSWLSPLDTSMSASNSVNGADGSVSPRERERVHDMKSPPGSPPVA